MKIKQWSEDVRKEYVISDLTSKLDDGRYRARAAVTRAVAGNGFSQRFLDLETFTNEADARRRAISAAQAWIEGERGRDPLSLPTGFLPFPAVNRLRT